MEAGRQVTDCLNNNSGERRWCLEQGDGNNGDEKWLDSVDRTERICGGTGCGKRKKEESGMTLTSVNGWSCCFVQWRKLEGELLWRGM